MLLCVSDDAPTARRASAIDPKRPQKRRTSFLRIPPPS
nr:MAG TPA: hypothetical protein [Caudoviricetes sp.]